MFIEYLVERHLWPKQVAAIGHDGRGRVTIDWTLLSGSPSPSIPSGLIAVLYQRHTVSRLLIPLSGSSRIAYRLEKKARDATHTRPNRRLLKGPSVKKSMALFARCEHVRDEKLVHREHMDAVLFEDRLQRIIASNHPPIVRILQLALFDILPYLLDNLCTRELDLVSVVIGCFEPSTLLTMVSPRKVARGVESAMGLWKPPDRLTSFFRSRPDAESPSLTSSDFRFDPLLRTTFFFFLTTPVVFRLGAPLVALARLFSSACNLAAYRASSSAGSRLTFFFAGLTGGSTGSNESSSSSSSSLRVPEVGGEACCDGSGVLRFEFDAFTSLGTGESSADGAEFCSALNLSNRAMINSLISAFCGVMSCWTIACKPLRMRFSEIVLRSLVARMASTMVVYCASTSLDTIAQVSRASHHHRRY